MFTSNDYRLLSNYVFDNNYPGHKPNVVESPDGNDYWDDKKRYAHINVDYLKKAYFASADFFYKYLNEAHIKASEIAIELGIPKAFWPSYEHGTLRILEYAPGAITHSHTDFNLFTLMCYRNIPECFIHLGADTNDLQYSFLSKAHQLNYQIHFGELLEIINPKCFKATKHEVIADEYGRTQYSVVYFAAPNDNAILPNGQTVGDWTNERKARSRKTKEL